MQRLYQNTVEKIRHIYYLNPAEFRINLLRFFRPPPRETFGTFLGRLAVAADACRMASRKPQEKEISSVGAIKQLTI